MLSSIWCQKISGQNECWLASLFQANEGSFITLPLHTSCEADWILIHIFFLHCMCLTPFSFTQQKTFTQRHPPLFKPSPAPTLHPSYNIFHIHIHIHISHTHIHILINIFYYLLLSTPSHSAFSRHLLLGSSSSRGSFPHQNILRFL